MFQHSQPATHRQALRKRHSLYLSREWDFDGYGNDLGQQTAIEGHHGCSGVIVGEHQGHLGGRVEGFC